MNFTHLHLVLNHLPVVGILFGAATLGIGLVFKNPSAHRVGLWLVVAAALVAIPAYLTGEPAEDGTENLPGVTEAVIEPHEEAAAVALALALAAGALAVPALLMATAHQRLARSAAWLCLGLSVAASGAMAYTANLGGEIRHTEIR
jgi:uncharacterized membrane protein